MRHRARHAAGFARQILDTARPYLSVPEAELEVLDVGCGYGFTTIELARRCRRAVGIEPSASLFEQADRAATDAGLGNIELHRASITEFSSNGEFDLVVLDNVLEHVSDQVLAMGRICDALKRGGATLIIVPNRLWPLEVHYDLPFLSYLPLPLANLYLRLSRRGVDYTDASYAPTWFGLRRLFASRPELKYGFVPPADVSLATLGHTWRYRAGVAALRRCPWLWMISKMFVVVAVKR